MAVNYGSPGDHSESEEEMDLVFIWQNAPCQTYGDSAPLHEGGDWLGTWIPHLGIIRAEPFDLTFSRQSRMADVNTRILPEFYFSSIDASSSLANMHKPGPSISPQDVERDVVRYMFINYYYKSCLSIRKCYNAYSK